VVGRNSFLAQHFLASLRRDRVVAISHDEMNRPDLLDGVDGVINFARHPAASGDDYRPQGIDPDWLLAERLGDRNISYVMLSSRKVYAPSTAPLDEAAPTGPQDAYGRHKLASEHRLRGLLGERLTVLRLANIFGYECIPGRTSFMALSLNRLQRKGLIHYNMNPFVERDFLPVEALSRLLGRIVVAPPGGVLNVGSGISLPTGRLALWILEGFGRGELVIGSPVEKDAFVLDVDRLRGLYGEPCSYEQLRATCIAIGQRLAAETD
jgi:dTDP-4-dehydrorhamnose reductase/UDP-glucose 4-epimerase